MAQVRRRPPQRGRPPPGRPRGRPEPEYEEDLPPPEPPFWERLILSKAFRLVVGATFGSAALAILIFLIGPGTISQALGSVTAFAGRQSVRLGTLGAVAVSEAIRDEGRRLWVETATPLPTPLPTATPLPSPTPFPTPPPPRRPVVTPTSLPGKPLQPGQPKLQPGAAPALPVEAALTSMQEYFEILSGGDVRRALQYWAPESAPEARSALDAAVERGEKYRIKGMSNRPLPQISGADVTVDLEVSDASGKTYDTQHRYQWRFVDNQWYIVTRLQ